MNMHVFDVLENYFKGNSEMPLMADLGWEEKILNFLAAAQFPEIRIILKAAVFRERARNGLVTMEECGRPSGKEVIGWERR